MSRTVLEAAGRRAMAQLRMAMLPVIALLVVVPLAAAADSTLQAYKLHAGDKIMVGVFDDPKLPPLEINISPDGRFTYPLIGEVIASGKTVEQLRTEMEGRLKKYIADPSVTLVVADVKGNIAYVIGQVNKPGLIEMNPAVNVLQALSIAGGMNPYAKPDSIIVIRSSAGGQSVLNFHYAQVTAGRDLAQNIQLESGDVVVVP